MNSKFLRLIGVEVLGKRGARRALGLATALTAMVAMSAPAAAQHKVELTGIFGYTFSEGVNVDLGSNAGQTIDRLNSPSGISYGGSIALWLDSQVQVGFLFDQQDSSLDVEGSINRELTGMSINNYHATVAMHGGRQSSQVRPFFMFGLGATQYSPDDFMGNSIEGEVQFSGTIGGGIKAYLNERIGVNFTGRWTPTYIKSDPGGLYCSPYWSPYYGGGCVVYPDTDYSNQFQLSSGLIFRF